MGAVREQAKAASHVAELMERVRSGVDEIRSAASEQEKGNQVVYHGSIAMREVAHQVRGTTEEQARGSGRIRESVDGVRDAVEQINGSLQEQSAACRSVVEFLEEVSSRTQSNEVSSPSGWTKPPRASFARPRGCARTYTGSESEESGWLGCR